MAGKTPIATNTLKEHHFIKAYLKMLTYGNTVYPQGITIIEIPLIKSPITIGNFLPKMSMMIPMKNSNAITAISE